MLTTTAPGKLILCGEHAVVYGRPALAVPVWGVQATVEIAAAPTIDTGITFDAPDLGERWTLHNQPTHPLSVLTQFTLEHLGMTAGNFAVRLRSTIPVASGMGSGAALGAALARAIAAWYDRPLDAATVSALVYEGERLYHGTPSGIDNTVVSWGQPVWFERTATGPLITPLQIGQAFTLVVGDTGVRCPTKITVGEVRAGWQRDPMRYEALFDEIGTIGGAVRRHLAQGEIAAIGPLLDRNHALLDALGVNVPPLQRLVEAARGAGAWGAKLAGGGGGGVMFALVAPSLAALVQAALEAAGAVQVLVTVVPRSL